jgi:hypothetical protein
VRVSGLLASWNDETVHGSIVSREHRELTRREQVRTGFRVSAQVPEPLSRHIEVECALHPEFRQQSRSAHVDLRFAGNRPPSIDEGQHCVARTLGLHDDVPGFEAAGEPNVIRDLDRL